MPIQAWASLAKNAIASSPRTTTSKQRGTGLGLAIVQSVISDHGGTISVQSQPEHGTTFVVELPRNLDKLHAPVWTVPPS